jgi:16S rRNA (guanine527-N7)-methyltransferase
LGNRLESELTEGLAALPGVDTSDRLVNGLLQFVAELKVWNTAYNLTAVRDESDMISRHLLDSLSILPWLQSARHETEKPMNVLDAGSGAGLPGIPLAMVNPEWNFTLVDSGGKKVRFLRHVQRQLSLANIHPVECRLEDYHPRQTFDLIVSRALTSLAGFANAVRHLADANTRLLAMKGRYPAEELGELPPWISIEAVEQLQVPGLHADRHLVMMAVSNED